MCSIGKDLEVSILLIQGTDGVLVEGHDHLRRLNDDEHGGGRNVSVCACVFVEERAAAVTLREPHLRLILGVGVIGPKP
jgi:hypothetical protein